MSVIAEEQNILLYQSYVIQGLQIQKKFHFALVPKLKFLFLHPDCTNLSFPHVETKQYLAFMIQQHGSCYVL